MYVYLAASSREIERVRHVASLVNEHNLTHPESENIILSTAWWDVISARGEANPVDAPFHERMKYAADDLQGVKGSDVLWLLYPRLGQSSVGCFWEAGYADALGLEIVISGPGQEHSIFTTRGCTFETDVGALDYLQTLVFLDDRIVEYGRVS